MVGRVAGGTVIALVALAGAAQGQQAAGAMPPGVTAQMVKEGETLFKGAGLCSACHGQDAKGIPNLGANLVDAQWVHSKGSYDEIVKQITAGVAADKSTTGVVMPPKGGTSITDAQVKAIAAYVWSVSHPAKK
jgi:mono/diheme cytochrome c family protein